MKISCQSCNAKYTIADEKVLGKIVKIRCKKCGATIVINGNEAGSAVPPADDSNQDTRVFDYTTQQGASGDQWTVNVNDGDQRTMTLAEIVSEYKAGVVNDESFCWKDGMSDWLPLREIGELYAACHIGPRLSLTPEQVSQQDDTGGGNLGALFGSSGGRGGLGQPASHGVDTGTNGNGLGALFGSGTPSASGGGGGSPGAARRAGGRGAVGDLFGAVEQAGGEHDAMALAAKGMPEPPDASKLTGQRNENSVLFSLSALTKNEQKESAPMAQGEGSGLIDIRALASASPSRVHEGAKVDDIMNLAGGGAFSPALAAPVLAPPQMMGSDLGGQGEPRPGSNKVLLIAILGGAALIAASIILVFSMMKKPDAPASASTTPLATTAADPAATGAGTAATGAVAQADPVAPAATAGGAAPPSTGAAAHDKAERADTKGATKPTSGSSKGGLSRAIAGNDSTAAPAAATPPAPKPAGLEAAMAQSAGPLKSNDSSGGGGSAPFDRGAASAALGAAAQAAASCKKPDGPTGSGHVKVTFQPNGSVSVVDVDQAPFQGTSVGGCVAGKFKSAHVPAFSGSAVSVGKSFAIN